MEVWRGREGQRGKNNGGGLRAKGQEPRAKQVLIELIWTCPNLVYCASSWPLSRKSKGKPRTNPGVLYINNSC